MIPEFFRFRTRMIFGFVLVWGMCITYALLQYTFFQRDELVRASRPIAWKAGVMPAIRGRILDADGIPLAWTELNSEIYLMELPDSPVRRENLLKTLQERFNFTYNDEMLLPIRVSLEIHVSQQNIEDLCKLMDKYKELQLRNTYTRRYVDYEKMSGKLGKCTRDDNGVLKGECGLEQKYEDVLSGRFGRFEVMQDRNGRWNPLTLTVLEKPVPGQDVRLTEKLGSLLQD